MRVTVNYFLGSIKNGSSGDFVNAIENMTAEQVESLTESFLLNADSLWSADGFVSIYQLQVGSTPVVFISEWAFENLPYDMRSVTNQDIVGKLIQKEVYCNQSSLVSSLPWEDFERENDTYYCVQLSDGEEEFSEEEKGERIEELREKLEEHEDNEPEQSDFGGTPNTINNAEFEEWEAAYEKWEEKKEQIESDIEALEDAESEYRDIYEHWVVSGWLESKLEGHGEVIVEHIESGERWWGRCTTGQAVLLDYVICKIAFDMEILEFQKNAWS